jgi:predicted ATPase
MNYETTFDRIAKDIIMQSSGNYNASMYWTDRAAINKNMLNQLDKEF